MKNILVKNILLSVVVVFCAAGICSAQTTLYFPQFVDGTADRNSVVWSTVIVVTNPAVVGAPAASGTITLTKDSGAPMNIGLSDPISGAVGGTFQLAGGQTKFFFSPTTGSVGPQPLNSGFATITSNLPVTAALIFIEYGPYLTFSLSGDVLSEAGVPVATPLTRQ